MLSLAAGCSHSTARIAGVFATALEPLGVLNLRMAQMVQGPLRLPFAIAMFEIGDNPRQEH
jgi:hypothetical protein